MAVTPTSASDTNGIGLQAFLKILTTQLTHQDPLKPLDNQEFVAQLAQFSSLEQQRELNLKVDQMLTQQSATLSIGVLGKLVDINNSDGTVATAKVTAIDFTAGTPLFTAAKLDGSGNPTGTSLTQLTLSQFVRVH